MDLGFGVQDSGECRKVGPKVLQYSHGNGALSALDIPLVFLCVCLFVYIYILKCSNTCLDIYIYVHMWVTSLYIPVTSVKGAHI